MRPIAFLPLAILAACAQAPTNQPASGAASDTAAPAQATPAPAVTPAEGGGQVAATAPVPPGYQVVVRNGQKYYCSDKPVLGSRLKSKATCLTQEQYEMARQDAKDKMREKQGQEVTWGQ